MPNGTLSVRIGKVPGRIYEVAVPKGTSVAQAAEAACPGLSQELRGYQVRMNNSEADLDSPIQSEDSTVLFVRQIKGN